MKIRGKTKKSFDRIETYFDFGIDDLEKANRDELRKSEELCSKFIKLVETCGKLKEKQTTFQKQFASAVKTKNYSKAAEILPKQIQSTLNCLKKENEFYEFVLKYFVSKKKIAKLIKKDAKKIKKMGYKPLIY
jgi:hypothetical protein